MKNRQRLSLFATWELLRLVHLAIKLNREEFPVWIHFSGHVGQFQISYMKGPYSRHRKYHDVMREYLYASWRDPVTVRQIRGWRKELLAASDYKARREAPQLSGQKFKVIQGSETLALLDDFNEAQTYAARFKAKVIRADWHRLTSEDKALRH